MLLLDFSAAVDHNVMLPIDHNVMLHRLSHDIGPDALDWFKSYMSDSVQFVHINGCTSPACPLTCGSFKVLYSVCSCSLFTYAAPLSKIFRNNKLTSYFYVDDTQICITMTPRQQVINAAVECIERCIKEIRIWMKTNTLKLNDSKTE